MKLHATRLGEGKPILILHGLYGSSDNWQTIGMALSKEGFSTHMIDLRNHGRSPHSDTHNYPSMVEDIKTYMEDNNIEKTIILGHSMGGKTAMLFTLTYPHLVEKLIVADIAPKYYPKNYDNHLHILHTMSNLDLNGVTTRKEIETILSPSIKRKEEVQLIMKNLQRDKNNKFKWKINIPALTKNLDEITGGTEGWATKSCKTECLFLRGEESDYLSLDDDFIIKKSFPNSELTAISNAGHWLHAEQPELVLKTILYFIK